MSTWILRECGGSVAKAATVTYLGLDWVIGTPFIVFNALWPSAAARLDHIFSMSSASQALIWWLTIPGGWLMWYGIYRQEKRLMEIRQHLEESER